MDYLSILNIKFGKDTKWEKTGKCGWCTKKINITDNQYLIKGNICLSCTTMINKKLETIKHDKEYNKLHPKEKMEVLSEILEDPITEEERIEVVVEMEKEYNNIIHYEVL